jgi:tRNA A-37 threonylcarbamoyl transferase component Bud32
MAGLKGENMNNGSRESLEDRARAAFAIAGEFARWLQDQNRPDLELDPSGGRRLQTMHELRRRFGEVVDAAVGCGPLVQSPPQGLEHVADVARAFAEWAALWHSRLDSDLTSRAWLWLSDEWPSLNTFSFNGFKAIQVARKACEDDKFGFLGPGKTAGTSEHPSSGAHDIEEPMPQQDERVDSDIELLKRHASGLFGVVWQARQPKLDRLVAVKFIRGSMANAVTAVDHARSLARVNHPNVVTVYQVARLRDPETSSVSDCVVMEWIEGQRLADRLNGRVFTSVEAREICTAILDGLAAIHDQAIAHSDLHAGNVLLTPDDAKIIDIGYAEPHSLAHLSATSRNVQLIGDIEAARYLLLRVLQHSDLPMSVVMMSEPRLRTAQSIDELRMIAHDVEQKQQESFPTQRSERSADATAIDLTNPEVRYVMALSRPRNQQGIGLTWFDDIGTPVAAEGRAMVDRFIELGLMRHAGMSFMLTKRGYDLADKLWRTFVLHAVATHQQGQWSYVDVAVVAEAVQLTDGEEEARELNRHLDVIEQRGFVELVRADCGIAAARMTPKGHAELRLYAGFDYQFPD